MLSDNERKALREIELRAASDDPAFAAMLSPKSNRAVRRMRLAYDVVAAVAIVLALVCIPLGQVGPGLVALAFGALVIALRRRRFAELSPPSPTRPGSPTGRV
jgi:hypothetical protein